MSDRCSPPPSGGHPAFTDRPTVPELKELLSELVDWRRFGAHLPGMTKQKIVRLGKFGNQSVGSRKEALFTRWLREYEKASWNDVITALYKSEEYKLLSSVTDDIKRRYTSGKHGQTTSESSQATNGKEQTTSIADDDAPNDDELRKDAKRAITRNIDKLTDVISSVNTFRDTVLGCAAKELIPTSFKNSLFDFSTTKDRQMKTIELLNFLENFISFNPAYLDVFLTVLAEKSGKTGREVASDIAKEYGHKLPQFTISMADDVPSDELMKDAKRAITRNIDQLTNFLSSSEIIFEDIRLGFTNELIPTSFKDNLLSTSTTLDTRAKAVELVRCIEDMVSTNPTYLDVFLTILNAKCGGRVGGEVIRNIAKEYGHKLPLYDDMIAAKPVIGAVGGAVSSNDTANRSEITLISESQVKEDIKSLYRSFGSLVSNVRFSLVVSKCNAYKIAIYIEAIIASGPLSITQGITVDELFDKIQPHYSFLDFELLEAIANEFLSEENELQIELTQYIEKVNKFTESSRLLHIKTAIEKSSIFKQDITDTTCRIIIKLSKKWDGITLNHFHDVLKYLFPSRKNILAHIHIEGGSIIISFIAPLSQSQYLIDNVLSKKNFLQRIGIIEVSINDQSILLARVDDINLNQSLLEASEEGDQLGVSILLQLGASINYKNGEGKTSLMLACSGGHEHVVQTLLSANADVNSQDWLGYTALMRAVESHSIRIVSSLLEHNADPNKIATHTYISTALITACTSCQTDVVKLLLSYNADPSIQSYNAVLMSTKTDDHLNILSQLLPLVSKYIYIILTRAVEYGQPQIIATLLKHVPDITNEQLHLSVSCCKGDYRTVEKLIYHPNVDLTYPLLPPLILASSCGHLPIVELLLKQHIPVDIKSVGDYTSLMYASANGHLRIVELLLKRQANVNIQNRSENTALILASQNGHHQVVELLHKNVNSCANCSTALIDACSSGYHEVIKVLIKEHNNFFVNIQNTDGFTALMGASENGHHQVVELLLNHHADVNILNNNSCTALILASQFGHHQVVKLLLKKHAYVNIRKKNGSSTALFLASYKGHHQVVKLLLKEHADVNIDTDAGVTALMAASRNGHHQIAEWLLIKHADVNIRTDSGFTALLFASENGHHQVVERLLKEHADVNICDIDGRTALIIASQNGHYQVVEQLLKKHADINIRDNKYGCTALIQASVNGYHQVVELLLNKHADVNIHTADNGFTALMIASRKSHHQVVNLLLQKCADVNNRSNDGYTALILASEYGHDKIVELLLKEDADVNILDNDGYTALFVACVHNHQEVVKLLLKKPIQDYDKWRSFMIAKYYGRNEIVEILLDEIVTPQTDSSNSTGFKPVHDELISKSEGQDDYTIQPATTQSFLDPFMLNQKEKEILLKDLTARKTKLTSSSLFAPRIDVGFLMRHQPKEKPSTVSPSPLTTLPLEHSQVM